MLLQLTDGTTTLTLSGSTPPYYGVTYFPASKSMAEAEKAGATITETVELYLNASSAAGMADGIAEIERLLLTAHRRQQESTGDRVYVVYQNYAGGRTGRSEVLDGEVAADENPQARQLDRERVRVWITWERRPFWEDNTERQIVDNETITNDAGANSYYTATPIAGVLPAPVRWQLTNTSGSDMYTSSIHAAINYRHAPATLDSTLSGGTWNYSAPVLLNVWLKQWELTAAQWQAFAGDRVRFLGVFNDPPTAAFYQMHVRYGGVDIQSASEQVFPQSDSQIFDVGEMALPPAGAGTTETDTDVEIAAGSPTIDVDDDLRFMQMVPADNHRKLEMTAALLPNNGSFIDDPYQNKLHATDGSGAARPELVRAKGNPLRVFPGQQHRFILLWTKSTQGYVPTESYQLDAWYRPRWLTVV